MNLHDKIEMLPVFNKVLSDAESKLSQLCGYRVVLTVKIPTDEVNESYLQQLVCDQFEVTWHDVKGASRKTNIKDARQAYHYIARQLLGRHYSQLGRDTGRDHTTAIASCKRITELLEIKDVKVVKQIGELLRKTQSV